MSILRWMKESRKFDNNSPLSGIFRLNYFIHKSRRIYLYILSRANVSWVDRMYNKQLASRATRCQNASIRKITYQVQQLLAYSSSIYRRSRRRWLCGFAHVPLVYAALHERSNETVAHCRHLSINNPARRERIVAREEENARARGTRGI